MLALKYTLMIAGLALFGSTGALVAYDVYLAEQLRRVLNRKRAGDWNGARMDLVVSGAAAAHGEFGVQRPDKSKKRPPAIAPPRAAFSSGRA